MQESRFISIKEATADMSNPQYFLDTIPEEYSAKDYISSCHGASVQDESTVKRLQDEWRCKLIPHLNESDDRGLQETGTRLEKAWKNEKRRMLESVEVDEQVSKRFKRDMRQAFQEHQVTVMRVSARRLEQDLSEILGESEASFEPPQTLSSIPPLSNESLPAAAVPGQPVDSDSEVNNTILSDALLPARPVSFDQDAGSTTTTSNVLVPRLNESTPATGSPTVIGRDCRPDSPGTNGVLPSDVIITSSPRAPETGSSSSQTTVALSNSDIPDHTSLPLPSTPLDLSTQARPSPFGPSVQLDPLAPLIEDLWRPEEGERPMGGPNAIKSATHVINPFQWEAGHDDNDEDEEEDAVTIVQEQGFHPLNVVFDYDAFTFSCIIGHYDISEPFNSYYEEAIAAPYDHNAFQDFLATAGILFLSKEPTNLQRQHFGEHFETLREVMAGMVQPNDDDKQAAADEEDDAVEFCQAARNVYRKAERSSGSGSARKQLKRRIEQEEDSPLKELYEHAVKLPKECSPVSEADQTSTFILGMLRPIFDRPDFSRLAHTATKATSGSIFLRLCKNLAPFYKKPDLLVRVKESLDIGVAEVSFEASEQKDTGDLCRTALWSKRVLDQIVTRFENLEEAGLIFFHVVEKTCTFYTMRRAATVCVAMELARLDIAYTISDVLTNFEKDARDWLLICRTFETAKDRADRVEVRKGQGMETGR